MMTMTTMMIVGAAGAVVSVAGATTTMTMTETGRGRDSGPVSLRRFRLGDSRVQAPAIHGSDRRVIGDPMPPAALAHEPTMEPRHDDDAEQGR